MARQRFGQNFLVDPHWKKKIVESFEPPADFAEIGPGKGAITDLLKNRFQSFSVFEIDPKFADYYREDPQVNLLEMDFLSWDFCLGGRPVKNFSLIGNLPYESGTAMIKKICGHQDQISHFVFMLQREVAERITAKEKTRAFGSLSVLVQSRFRLRRLGVIPPEAFKPAPKVDSRVIIGWSRQDSQHPCHPQYHEFLSKAFQQKRKRLRNNLLPHYSVEAVQRCFNELGLSENARAEEIPVDDWAKIFKLLDQS